MNNSSDLVQQIARIVLYVLTGWLAKVGITDSSVLADIGAIVTGVVSVGWWLLWHNNKVATT